MIIGINGKVIQKEPTYLHINVNNIIYRVFISLNCSNSITSEQVNLLTTYIVKEDSQSLYGFIDINEKKLFDTVIKINGVGPKVALAICSTFTPSSFAQIISTKDVGTLTRVPGIGPKGASRILIELSGFFIDNDITNNNINFNEASLALESLGFKKNQIDKVLANCSAIDTAQLVKEALKKLQKK